MENEIKEMIFEEIKLCKALSDDEARKRVPDCNAVAALATAMTQLVYAYYAEPIDLRPVKL